MILSITESQLNLRVTAQNESAPSFDQIDESLLALDANVKEVASAVQESFQSMVNAMREAVTSAVSILSGFDEPLLVMAANVQAVVEETTTQLGEISTSFEGISTAATSAGEGATAGLTPLRTQLTEIGDAAFRAQTGIEALGVTQAAGGTTGAPGAAGASRGSHSSMGNDMNAAMSLSMIAMPLDMALKKAVESSNQFDQAMRNVNTMMQLSEGQFETMKSQVMDLSQVLPYSATEMAQGLYMVYSANVPLKDSLSFTKVAAESAAAGMGTMDDSVLALTETIKGYGMAWGDVNKVSDLMFQTIKDGQTTFPELAKNIGTVANMASQSGVRLDELMASYATLTGVTGDTAEVTTQLSGIYKEVIHPTAAVAKEAKSLGLEFSASAIQAEGFSTWLQHVADKTGGNVTTLGKLFPNVRALRGIVALTTTQLGTYNTKLGDMQHASDGAGQTAAAFGQAIQGQADQFKLFENHVEKIGELATQDLLPAINNVMTGIEGLINWFGQHPVITKFAVEAVAATAVLATLGATFFFAKTGIEAIGMAVGPMNSRVGGLITGLRGAATAATAAAEGAEVAGGALTLLGGPVTLVVAGVAALGIGLYEAYKHSETFRNGVDSAVQAVKDGAHSVKEFFWGQDYIADIKKASNQSVADVVKMTNDTEVKLAEFKTTTGALSKATADSVINASNTMRDKTISAADARLQQETADAQLLQQNLGTITQGQVDEIVAKSKTQHQLTVDQAKQMNQQVTAEIDKMRKAGVNVTDQMKNDIIKKFEQQRDSTIKVLSDNQVQAQAVLEMLKHNSGQITAQIASQTIKDANAQRDGAVKAANDQYTKTVQAIVRMRDQDHIITAGQADDMIAQAKRQRDNSVAAAEDMRAKVVDKIAAMMGNSKNQVDLQTGNILSGWDKFVLGMEQKTSNMVVEINKIIEGIFGKTIGSAIEVALGTYGAKTSQVASTVGAYKSSFQGHHYASGTDYHPGGWAITGEEGPELINLPAGSQVINHRETMSILHGLSAPRGYGSGGATVHGGIQVYVNGAGKNGKQIGNDVATALRQQLNFVL